MENAPKKRIWFVFGLYAAVLIWLLFGQRLGSPLTEETLGGASRLNLEPFAIIRHFLRVAALADKPWLVRLAVVNLAGNVAVFVPMGVFLPWLWPPMRKLWLFLPVVLALIVLIETVQYSTYLGVCDVDDLILNAAGCLIGWGIFTLARHIRRKKSER